MPIITQRVIFKKIIVSIGVIIFFLYANTSFLFAMIKNQSTMAINGKLIIIIFDPSIFQCPLCLESLLDFCEKLNAQGMDPFAVGIYLIEKSDENDFDKTLQIAKKRLRGFVKGNNIKFQIIVDTHQVFQGLDCEIPCIIIFDGSESEVKKYTLPLTGRQLNDLFSFHKTSLRRDNHASCIYYLWNCYFRKSHNIFF